MWPKTCGKRPKIAGRLASLSDSHLERHPDMSLGILHLTKSVSSSAALTQARAARPPVKPDAIHASTPLALPAESRTNALSAKQKGGPEPLQRASIEMRMIQAADLLAFRRFHLSGRIYSPFLTCINPLECESLADTPTRLSLSKRVSHETTRLRWVNRKYTIHDSVHSEALPREKPFSIPWCPHEMSWLNGNMTVVRP